MTRDLKTFSRSVALRWRITRLGRRNRESQYAGAGIGHAAPIRVLLPWAVLTCSTWDPKNCLGTLGHPGQRGPVLERAL